MPHFKYRARDNYGVLVEGTIEGASRENAASRLMDAGYTPVKVDPTADKNTISFGNMDALFEPFSKIKSDTILIFTRELEASVNAGIPLLESLDALALQDSNQKFKGILGSVKHTIESGGSFSEALAKYPKVFSKTYVSMVKTGETSGMMDKVLGNLVELIEHEEATSQKIKASLRYPFMVVVTLSVAILILLAFVVPRFAGIFAAVNQDLPLPTKILVMLSTGLQRYWLIIFGGIIAAVYGLRKYIETPQGRRVWDSFVIKIPIFGDLIVKLSMSKFSKSLGTLLESGVPILEALRVTADTVENVIIAGFVRDMEGSVSKGRSLSDPMATNKLFPPLVVHMVQVGEKAGEVPGMLLKISDHFDNETDYTIKNLVSMLEPFLIFVLAFFVLFIAFAIFLPMWDMLSIVQK
ncbi:MAG: type II secretion system F family protein [bacterium]